MFEVFDKESIIKLDVCVVVNSPLTFGFCIALQVKLAGIFDPMD
jgi:hypothetical protein